MIRAYERTEYTYLTPTLRRRRRRTAVETGKNRIRTSSLRPMHIYRCVQASGVMRACLDIVSALSYNFFSFPPSLSFCLPYSKKRESVYRLTGHPIVISASYPSGSGASEGERERGVERRILSSQSVSSPFCGSACTHAFTEERWRLPLGVCSGRRLAMSAASHGISYGFVYLPGAEGR